MSSTPELSDDEKKARKRAKNREYMRKRRAADPNMNRNSMFKSKYGITVQQRDAMLAGQGGKCPMCLTEDPGDYNGWCIDHCHASGKVRGILCRRCNLLLGYAGDNPQTLARAIQYLNQGP